MIIDMEHHAATPDRLEKGSSPSGLYCERYWDNGKMKIRSFKESSRVKERLEFMDEAGIDVALLTTNPLTTLDQCRRWNDFCAQLVQENPRRFVGFATIPPLGGQPALTELERTIKQLGLKGVHISTRNQDYHMDSSEMWPFYEKVAELKIPIDVHVTLDPSGYDAAHAPYALHLVFIINHFGGGVTGIMERLDAYLGYVGPGCPSFYTGKELISKPWREYFDKLYFNMAGRQLGMATIKSALTVINPQKLMFGTDWPFNYDHNAKLAKQYIHEIRQLPLPQSDIDAILGGTAARLLDIPAE
jgi:predicted TIM-barrel fold metal-dependent hydrolase